MLPVATGWHATGILDRQYKIHLNYIADWFRIDWLEVEL